MGTVLSYSIVSAIILLCCYIPYRWFMSSRKQYAFNRLTILAIYGLSAFLPFIIYREVSNPQGIINALETPESYVLNSSDLLMAEEISVWKIVILAYAIGFLFQTLLYLLGVIKIMFIVSKSHKVTESGNTVAISEDEVSPFSWGNTIVMSKTLYESNERLMVITHENAHVKKLHWIDLLIAQIMTSLQWFNPAAWMLRNHLKEVHEFQADEFVLSECMNPYTYQLFLVSTTFSSKFNLPVDFLNAGNIRKRIIMMNCDKTTDITHRLAAISLLPFLCIGISACNLMPSRLLIQQINNTHVFDSQTNDDNSYDFPIEQGMINKGESANVATMNSESIIEEDFHNAEYIGGQAALMKFLIDNMKYPKIAEANHTQGKVVVAFEISADGDVLSVEIDTPVDKYLDEEALRVCNRISKFKPASLNGTPLASIYRLPITFELSTN